MASATAVPPLVQGIGNAILQIDSPQEPMVRIDQGQASQRRPTTGRTDESTYWLDQMDHTGPARGFAPFIPGDFTYQVYRNVKASAFGARGDGSSDDSGALQNAIDFDGQDGDRSDSGENTLSTRPAEVFIPGGTYVISRALHLPLNTIVVGDPNNLPVIKAASSFSGSSLIDSTNHPGHGELEFFMAIKNIILDTTAIDKDTPLTALEWATAQACQLTNVQINMPTSSSGHVGISMQGGSATTFSDVSITGGKYGILYGNQQVNIKNVNFTSCDTAISLSGGFTAVVQGATFDTCGHCIDASPAGSLGSLVLLDSTASNSGEVVKFFDSSQSSGDRNNQIIIENLHHSGKNPVAVTNTGATKLASILLGQTWVWGNVSPGGYQTGKISSSPRPSSLVASNGNFFTMPQPSYANLAASDVVNVKAVKGFPVKGDGRTDDSASLNAILAQAAANGKLVYVPYGVYVLGSTLYVPPGIRMVGECWPAFSGIGGVFGDASNPVPIVMVGKPGEVGIAQIQDIRFTVADIVPGGIILQVNMAGRNNGDVAFWNSHVTVGGFVDSNVNVACTDSDTADCKAAFAMVHLSKTSSVYIENMWGWTADHSNDGGPDQRIATGRGLLVEATKGTWLAGTAFEHNALYNYNLHAASNVFAGMQQSETAYWQGDGATESAPLPWKADNRYGDPDFSWCAGGDQSCRMGLAQNIDGGSNLFLYGAALWTFFHGANLNSCGSGCIKNQARVTNTPQGLNWYGVNTRCADTIIFDGVENPREANNPGGWSPGGVIAAYLQFSGLSSAHEAL